MLPQIVLVSGPVGAGKTTLCEQLASNFDAVHFKSREYLLKRVQRSTNPSGPTPRDRLQELGNVLDRQTRGAWIVDGVRELIEGTNGRSLILVDAVRIRAQVESVRTAYGARVVHIHVTAPLPVLGARYQHRVRGAGAKGNIAELKSYSKVRVDPTENRIEELACPFHQPHLP